MLKGASYVKKTDKAMCEELGNEDNMFSYVEEAGNTVPPIFFIKSIHSFPAK